MAYKRVSNEKIRRHKKRAQEVIDKYETYDSFTGINNRHFAHNLKYRDHFAKGPVSLEPKKLDSVTSIYNEHRRKAPSEIDGEGLPQNAIKALCNLQNFTSYFVLNDVCVEHGLSVKDVLLLLWLYQFEYVSIKYAALNYHAKEQFVYKAMNKLSKCDMIRGVRVRTNDHPRGIRSGKKVKMTEQGNLLCLSFFQEIQRGLATNLPEMPKAKGVQTILEENLYRKEVDPLLVKSKRKHKDEVYPPAISKKILKDMLRAYDVNGRVNKNILKGRYKASDMERYKSKELHFDLLALRRELEDDEED